MDAFAWRIDPRIFQKQTIEAVICTVFEAYGALPDSLSFNSASLSRRTATSRNTESDSTFVLRPLEHEGLFFYFDHDKEKHTPIILITSDQAATTAANPLSHGVRDRDFRLDY